ncbi:MAG TPA: peptide-methionine (S)-S-oxide reductase MsrA [Pirellulales bacterium]|nr:peptide-methionine (S)-S-oxide reductase MsrA [Pirellulales bacterium]
MTDAPKPGERTARPTQAPPPETGQANEGLETATFGGGCFWCTEAVFQQLKGVQRVVSGYSGGHMKNPTYRDICAGDTGHAEVIQVEFNPKLISFAELLDVFWKTHDATTLNRQGNDEGTQYRSVIYHHNDEQRRVAEHIKRKLDESGGLGRPIVTEIAPFSQFYPAEDYHQNYFADNPQRPYCAAIIQPKVDKVRTVFQNKLK